MGTLPAVDPLAAHHDGSDLYVGDGTTPSLGATIEVRVRVPHRVDGTPGAHRVVLRSVLDGEPRVVAATATRNDAAGTWWSADLLLGNPLTSYRFALADEDGGDFRWLTASGVHRRDVTDAGDFRVSTEHRLPDWVPDQVGYQVFPDRFARSGAAAPAPGWARPAAWDDPVVHQGPDVAFQLYGGTLDGVVEHLDHLVDLGATLLYLTPVFAAHSNHRYDAVSFDAVDPVLGGDDALRRLLAAAHDRDLRVVGDLTTNHTGEHHDWFLAARADPDSPERAFYFFDDAEEHGYRCWWGIASLPKLDHRSAELARRLHDGDDSVAARWLREGLDGWRIDVANMTGRTEDQDLAHQVAVTLRRTAEETRPGAWVLAEHGHDASLDLTGPGWHGTMDYAGFTRPVWCWLNGGGPAGPGHRHGLSYLGLPVDLPRLPAESVVATMREVHAAVPWSVLTSNTLHLDSHDVPRFRTVTGGGTHGWVDAEGTGRERHLLGLALQMTMPGVPVVFAGGELGLTGTDGEHARTPMPWGRREEWDAPTLAAHRRWIALRHEHVALRRGGLRWLHADADAMTYLREHPDETLLVHLVRASGAPVRLPAHALGVDVALEALEGEPARLTGADLLLPGAVGAHVSRVVHAADGSLSTTA